MTTPTGMKLQTLRLELILQTREEVEEMIAAMPADDRAQISDDWLARLRASTGPNPWVQAFRVVQRDTGAKIGMCSFKGPPVDGAVEIAYGIDPEHQRKGYATEAAQALVDFALTQGDVCVVLAHTLTDGVASQRVLVKCGLQYVGDVVDPEDGLVSRFELPVGRI